MVNFWTVFFVFLLGVAILGVAGTTRWVARFLWKDKANIEAVGASVIGSGACLLLAWGLIVCTPSPGILLSEGTRSGRVYRVARKGVFWKTWEGSMSMGAMEETEKGFAPVLFDFSVTDFAVVEQLHSALRDGLVLELEYKEYFLRGYPIGSTNYEIVAVRPHAAR